MGKNATEELQIFWKLSFAAAYQRSAHGHERGGVLRIPGLLWMCFKG